MFKSAKVVANVYDKYYPSKSFKVTWIIKVSVSTIKVSESILTYENRMVNLFDIISKIIEILASGENSYFSHCHSAILASNYVS